MSDEVKAKLAVVSGDEHFGSNHPMQATTGRVYA
jgi:hypothetical protein